MTDLKIKGFYVYRVDAENPGSYHAIAKTDLPDSYIEFNESEKPGYWGRYKIDRMVGREHRFGRLKDAKEELELRASLLNKN